MIEIELGTVFTLTLIMASCLSFCLMIINLTSQLSVSTLRISKYIQMFILVAEIAANL